MPAHIRRTAAALLATGAHALLAGSAAAHGGVTGARDVLEDYGVLIFLLAVVLIGAGVLTWVFSRRSPMSKTRPRARPAAHSDVACTRSKPP